MAKKSVAIIYHFVPHYRIGFAKELSKSNFFSDYIWYANTSPMEGIPALDKSQLKNIKETKNIWIGKLLFQPSVISMALTGKYDSYVFLASPNFLSTWIASAILKIRGKNVIFWGHGFFSTENNLKNKLRKKFFSLSSSSYLYGCRARDVAEKIGFNSEKIYVGFNSLDYENQIKIRERLENIIDKKTHEKSIKILAISRLTKICRYDLLLDAIKIAEKISGNKYEITFIGDGPEKDSLLNKSIDLRVNAKFMGAIYDDEVIASIIRSSDLVAQPGKIGLTAMHALMFGTPVISHSLFEKQMPEVESIVEGITGMLHKFDDTEDIARCLIEFPKIFCDKKKIRADCYQVIDKLYNPTNQIKVLADAVNRAPPSNPKAVSEIFVTSEQKS